MVKKANKAKRPKDKYYQLAKEQGYRARSAFKLIQLNKKYDFLGKSGVLIDLCAAPGGWLQVAAKYMPSGSTIIGVDLMPIKPIRGVISHREDITTQECRTMLRRDMGSRKADVVLHDGAPNVGQNWTKDAYTQSELVLCSLKLAVEFLRPHGMFITKVFRSTDYNSLLWVFNQLFGKVEATKPHSSRNASAEIFVVCRDFRAPDRIDPKLLDPRYVFKELDDLVGSGTGVAGGGGASALTVLDKKATQHNKRQREGYDETLGPLLTKRVPVLTFMRSEQPVRVLTDASALVFDEETKGLGVDDHKYTTPEIVTCCGDLKVLGKKDFKDLLRWRFAVRRSVPAAAIPLPSEAGAGADEEGDEDSDSDEDSGSEGGDGSEGSTDAEEEAEAAELSAAAAEELRRRKKEKKRDARMKAKAVRRQRLGMGLRNIDMTDQDHELFNLADLQRLARRVGEGSAAAAGAGAGAGSDDPLAAIREVNLEDGSSSHALAAAYGGPSAALRSALFGDEADLEFAAASGEGAGGHAAADSDEEDEEEGAPPAVLGPDGELAVDVVGALRDRDRANRLGQLEDDFDRAYALYLAKREKRAAESAAALERGDGRSKGIKLSRMERLKQQAVLTEAALSGQIDAEHQKYLKMLANARSEAEAAAAASSEPTTVSGVKRRRPDGEESDEDDDSSLDLSDEEEDDDDDEEDSEEEDEEEEDEDGDDIEDAEVEDEDRAEAAAERVLAGRARSAAGKASSSGHPISAGPRGASASLTASTKANRWFSNDLFSSVLAAPPAAGAGAPAAAAAAGAGGKRAAAAMQLDADSEDEEGAGGSGAAAVPTTGATKRARVAAAAAANGTGATVGAVGKDGEPDWLAGLPRSERDKWHDKLRRQRERKERAATRFARKEGAMKVVSSGSVAAEDADDEFSRVVAALAGGAAAAAAGSDDDEGGTHFTDRAGRRHGGGAGSDSEDSGAAGGRRKPAAPAVAFDAMGAARQQARRELIKAGMGAAVAAVRGKAALAALEADADASGDEGAAAEVDTGFEVVPAPRERRGGYDTDSGTDSDDDSDDAGSGDEDVAAGKAAAGRPESPDPRSQLYDPDTHAELLALGAKMRSHSSAKALVDASYNRYAFDDVGMPAWFEADEARHFKPQLPVTKAEVDAIRERFREIAARPVARVAEARARKRLRVDKKLAKIKKQAEGIEESEEVQGRSKQRALARLYKGAEVRRPSSVYIVSSSGGSHGAAQARAKRKGSNVKVVDPRLKKDLKAQRRVAAKQKGGRGGGGGGGRKVKAGKGPAAKRARR